MTQNGSTPPRAVAERSPLSPLTHFVPVKAQRKKRPMDKEILNPPKTAQERGAGTSEQRGGAHDARDEDLHRNKGDERDERDERDEDEGRHPSTPHGSPRILASATPEASQGARGPGAP
jgi:hypothetical protein